MADTIHLAITRRVRKEHTETFERLLADFASRSLAMPGSRGVHLLYPPPGSDSAEYGLLRSFANEADRDAFYESTVFRDWTAAVQPMTEGSPIYRTLDGLEAFFRESHGDLPPRWKMAFLTWVAVWPVSMAVPALLVPILVGRMPGVLLAGIVAAGIVVVLTWAAMPVLVRIAHPWLHGSAKR